MNKTEKGREANLPAVHVDIDDRGRTGRIVTVTIDNAAKINVLNSSLIEKCTDTIKGFHDDVALRVMILTGAGERAWIGGADITEMVDFNPDSAEAFITRIHLLCSAIREIPVPVIARIAGYCLGAGPEVAAACDLRIATADSIFGMPEVKVGVPSVIEAALLPRLIGWGRTAELVYTGRTISAAEALNWGLVERVVLRDELDKGLKTWVEDIVTSAPRAIRLQKKLIRQWESVPVDQAIEKGIQAFRQSFQTDEPRTFMKRFIERER